MAKASLTIIDNEDGTVQVEGDFGDVVDTNSQAHSMVMVLIESVLKNSKRYETIEDTAPEVNVEPSRIITQENAHGI